MNILILSGKRIRLIDTLTVLLFLQFIFLNKMYMWYKLVFFTLIIFISLARRKYSVQFHAADKILIIYILYNIFTTFMGIAKGYGDVAIRSSTVNIIWPIFFLLVSGENISKEQLRKLYKLFINCILIMCLIDIYILIAGTFHLNTLNVIFSYWNKDKVYGTLLGGMPYFRTDNMYFLAFFLPFIMSCLAVYERHVFDKIGITKAKLIVASTISVITGVYSGMGGIWLSIFVGAIVMFFSFKLYKKTRWILFALIAFIVVGSYSAISYRNGGFAHYVVEEINGKIQEDDYGDFGNIRTRQRLGMLEKWLESPIFGSGVGSKAFYQRVNSYEETNDNEETYFVILYQRGLVGIILFFLVVYEAIKILKSRKDAWWFTYPFIIGMCSFLVSNAFNPYLSNMSMQWILFFPYVLNAGKRNLQKDFVLEDIVRT